MNGDPEKVNLIDKIRRPALHILIHPVLSLALHRNAPAGLIPAQMPEIRHCRNCGPHALLAMPSD